MRRTGALWLGLALATAIASAETTPLDDPRLLRAVEVSPLSGRLNLSLEDLRPGGETPWPLSIRRSYLPGWGDPQNHGAAWVSVLDARLTPWRDGFLLLDPRGSLRRFEPRGEGWAAVNGRPTEIERTAGGYRLTSLGRSLSFDSLGRLVRVAGQPSDLHLERDEAGRVLAMRGPWGVVTVERDEHGVLRALAAEDGRRVDYVRNAEGQLSEVRRPGVRQRYAYDTQGRLTSLGGGVLKVTYDESGRVSEVATSGQAVAHYSYADDVEQAALIGTVTQGERVVRHVVSSDLRRIRVEGPVQTTETELDERGRVVRELVDGVELSRSYDAEGRLSSMVSGSGTSTFHYANPQATLPSRAQTAQGSWSFTYDERGNLTSARSFAGSTRWVYDELGRLTQLVDSDGTVLELGYDDAHRRIAARLAQGQRQLERRAQRPQGIFGVSSVEQSEDGRTRTAERNPDGTLLTQERDSAGRHLRSVRYDALGRAVERTNSRGVTRRFSYDALGRWVSVAGAAGDRLRASYDAWGQLESLSDGNGNQSRFSLEDGWVIVDEPSWGLRKTRTTGSRRSDRSGEQELDSRFNERGQLIARTLPEGEQRYRYDAEGRLLEASGPDGGLRYAYDEGGRLIRVSLVGVDAGVDYSYTAEGRVQRASYPWGSVEHRYDDQGRLSALDLGEHGELSFAYDAQGRRARVDFPSGVQTSYRYEGDRVTEIRTVRGDALLERRAYTYDAAGRVSEVKELAGAVTLEHDAEGQLVSASGPDFARSYTYDAMGNRTAVERDGVAEALVVEAGNRLASQGEERFTYGARGALTRRGIEEQATTYRYDSLNRLVAAQLADGSEVRYGYAPNGARLWREDAAGRTYFVPGASGPVAEVDSSGSLRVGYLQGQGLDDALGAVHEGSFFAAHRDCVNSVTALTDAEGQVAARYRYTPFGETRSAEGGAWNRLRYTARPLDPATGLYNLRARHYAPDLGRFTSPDPAGYRGGANFYAYVTNDPTVLRDPLGLFPGIDIPGPFDEWAGDAVDAATDFGGDVLDTGSDLVGDAISAGGSAADWAFVSGPFGIDHNPFFFGMLPNPMAHEETVAFGLGVGTALLGTVTAPWTLGTAIWNDPLGTLRTFGQLGMVLQNPAYLLFGPEDQAGRNLISSFWGGVGNYWDAFLHDPEDFWRRNGEIAPEVVGLFLSGGSSATVTLLLKLNDILGNIAWAATILEASQPEEDEQGNYSVQTIPGTTFESLDQLAKGLAIAMVTELEVSGHYTYSSELLDESYDDFHEFVEAALELDEVKELLGEDVDY